MNSRQRIVAAFTHRQPDRTPIFEYVLQSPVADAILGRPYAAYRDGVAFPAIESERGWRAAVRQEAVDRVELAAKLGHDMMYVCPVPPPRSDSKTVGSSPPESPLEDPVEELRRRVTRGESETIVGPSEQNLEIYRCVREELARRDMDLPILAPAYHHGVWTDVALMQTMLLDEDLTRRHFALATARSLAAIEAMLPLNIDIFGIGGDFAGNRGPLISPELYRRFIVPQVRRCVDHIHAAGKWAVNASDGNLWPVMDDFLIGCDVDGYLEIDLHAGMDLAELKSRYGGRITFLGNLDCGNTLSFGRPEDVEAQTTDCLRKGLGGGHILCTSNAITPSVPPENFLAITRTYRKFFALQ